MHKILEFCRICVDFDGVHTWCMTMLYDGPRVPIAMFITSIWTSDKRWSRTDTVKVFNDFLKLKYIRLPLLSHTKSWGNILQLRDVVELLNRVRSWLSLVQGPCRDNRHDDRHSWGIVQHRQAPFTHRQVRLNNPRILEFCRVPSTCTTVLAGTANADATKSQN